MLTETEKKALAAARRRHHTVRDFAPLKHDVDPRYPDGFVHRVYDRNGMWFIPEAESSSRHDPVSIFVAKAPTDVGNLLAIIDRLTAGASA